MQESRSSYRADSFLKLNLHIQIAERDSKNSSYANERGPKGLSSNPKSLAPQTAIALCRGTPGTYVTFHNVTVLTGV